MRLLLTFIIFILGVFYTFGKENCCEQCCEYLGIFCNKGEFYLKKSKATDPEEIKKLVNPYWYNNKGEGTLFILYEKINVEENQNLNENDRIKVTKYKNEFNIDEDSITEEDNTKKWALFEIKYEKKNKEKETKYLYCSDIESIEDYGIFDSCKQYISVSVIACNTSNVTDMSFMFSDCSSLMELDLSNFNTETVTDMYAMFSGCASLQQLNLSKFDTKKVTNMDNMFFDCNSLQTVTFNNNLKEGIKQQLNELGLMEVKEEGNKITLKK